MKNDATYEEVGDRTDWILRLLYAPINGKQSIPIVGTTRLMKGCFLIDRQMEEEMEVETDFNFHPDIYGPLDPLVYEAVDLLEADDLITTKESQKYNGTEYALTTEGEVEAKDLFYQLSEEEQELLSWIKGKHVLKSLSKLLSFVYNQYPKMAKNSKLT